MAMNLRASSCLVLLALTSSFSQSLGDATHISGSSLVGVSSVSEILDQFFKKQELAGRKPPAWKGEAQAMISLVQSLKDIDPTTQAEVDKLVQNIIDTLKADVDNTKQEQADAKTTLDLLETNLKTELGGLDSQLTKVKGFSAGSKTCRDNVTTQTTEFYKVCSDNDRGDPCPTECGKPSTADFELTYEAKQTHTCDFEAGETAKECVAKLWGKVNLTRSNLTNKYNSWAAKKKACEEHMARCAVCNPLWDTRTNTIIICDGKRDVAYDSYCTLQQEQNGFCSTNETLYTQWSTVLEPAQVARVSEYSDLEFIICIFEKYLSSKTFTQGMISDCPRKAAADFYSFATPTGELSLSVVDVSDVPKCHGDVSHSPGSPLYDMTGLINEFKTDGHGTTVSVSEKAYSPDASPSSAICSA